ncbi:MAG: DUF3179 domain-containing protein [Anaerolineales bacterium]
MRFLFVLPILLGACASGANRALISTDGPDEAEPTISVNPTSLSPDELRVFQGEFSTDFDIHSVSFSEILSGGPPKDGIPAIDDPHFVSVEEADEWLRSQEPVIQVQVGDEARAYPIQILMWHEIVNDQIGALPILVTFCPLCNTAIAFERTVDGRVLDFGTTGRLRFSNLIMYDRQTETWWQQASGEAIVGELTGAQLQFYPALIVAWEDFRNTFPQGRVLSRNTGFLRDYGRNPYVGYDDINSSPFLFRGPITPETIPPMTRVLTVDLNGQAIAFPYETLAELGVINEEIGGQPVAIFWQPGVVSPLDTISTGEGREVGAAAAFSRNINGMTLTFIYADGAITDEQTGTTWDIFGRAVAGSLEGAQLEAVVSINHFWFSWAAFKPETTIYSP